MRGVGHGAPVARAAAHAVERVVQDEYVVGACEARVAPGHHYHPEIVPFGASPGVNVAYVVVPDYYVLAPAGVYPPYPDRPSVYFKSLDSPVAFLQYVNSRVACCGCGKGGCIKYGPLARVIPDCYRRCVRPVIRRKVALYCYERPAVARVVRNVCHGVVKPVRAPARVDHVAWLRP
ncbi:Uncharacterised protein [uncultured archaeon]|nr:Uncharacterised protein [uncultured archaeon]